MKKLLTIFPDKSPDFKIKNQSNENLKDLEKQTETKNQTDVQNATQKTAESFETSKNESVCELKNSINELKNEIIEFNCPAEQNYGDEILGELLNFLRRNKYMALLMMCRKISKINVLDGYAEIEFENNNTEVFSNENYVKVLKEFFQSKNLDIRYAKKQIEKDDAQILNELLGGKLKISRKN